MILKHASEIRIRAVILASAIVFGSVVYGFHFTSFLHPKELVWCVALLCLLALSFTDRQIPAAIRSVRPLLLLAGMTIIGLQVGFPAVPSYAIEQLCYLGMAISLAIVAFPLVRSADTYQVLQASIILSGVAVGGLALGQFAGVFTPLFPVFTGYDQLLYSVFGNQDLLGSYCAISLALLLGNWEALPWARRYRVFALVIVGAALVLSGCRAAWLAAGITVAILLSRTASRRSVLFPAVVLTGITACIAVMYPDIVISRVTSLIQGNDTGVGLRLWFWLGGLHMWLDSPLYGLGLGNYAFWSPVVQGRALRGLYVNSLQHNDLHTIHPHNDPIELLAETGLIGGLLMIWWLSQIRLKSADMGTALGLVSFAVVSLFGFPTASFPHLALAVLFVVRLAKMPLKKPDNALRTSLQMLLLAILPLAISGRLFFVHVPSALLRGADRAVEMGQDCSAYDAITGYFWPSPVAHFRLALCQASRSETAVALESLDRAAEGLDTAEFHTVRAALLIRDGRNSSAEWALEQALFRAPSSLSGYRLMLRVTREDEWDRVLKSAKRWLTPEEFGELETESLTTRAQSTEESGG